MSNKKMLMGLSLFVIFAVSVYAIPSGPTAPQRLTRLSSSRYDPGVWPDLTIEAEAGNVTEISLYSMSQTKTWQGFYGNITGMITLDDALNFTMYDWFMAEPKGEIYASTATVDDWLTIHCFNYTNNGTEMSYTWDNGERNTTTDVVWNLSEIENFFGLLPGDYDGVDETFDEYGRVNNGTMNENITGLGSGSLHKEFYVGTINISRGSCPATSTYQASCVNITNSSTDEHLRQILPDYFCNGTNWEADYPGNFTSQDYRYEGKAYGEDFQEVLLTVNNSESIIFTTIIENDEGDNRTDIPGYNNGKWDFQMLVLDDGHPGIGQDNTTTYYFYVELN